MLVETRKFYEQSKQGAIGAASAATVREPARQVGGAMKAAARLTDWLQPPDVNPETGIPIWQQAESTFFGPETVTPVEKPAPVPVEQTGLYQAGESLQRGAEKMFPVNPLRQEDFLTQVGSGIGSLPTSFLPYVGPAIYAGSTAEDAAEKAGRFYDNKIAEAMAAGNGAEANRLQEEKKYQQALQFGLNAPLGYATERFLGVVPGLKQITEGGGKLIPKLAPGQIVENTKKLAGYFVKQGVKPTIGEFAQEGLEQAGGNLSEMAYNPEAEFLDGVINASGVGGTVGATTSIPLSLLGSKLRKNRLDRIKDFRDTRLAEGPLSAQQINEINDRIVAGQPLAEPEPGSLLNLLSEDPAARSSVGGNNAELLPNSTATLAGINSGGAPSGPINITPPPVTGGAPDEAKIPDMALETDVADEEIVAAVTPETVAATETSVAAETPAATETPAAAIEVQPLTVEETQEYNDTLDAAQGGSVYDILNDEQLIRFEELAGRVRQLEQAGFEFDETTGWTKPAATTVAAEAPVAPAAPAPAPAAATTITPEMYRAEIARAGGNTSAADDKLNATVREHLGNGGKVILVVDGKPVEIVQIAGGMLTDAQNQRWGTMSLATGKDSLKNSVRFLPAPTSAPAPAAAPKPARTVVLTPGAVTVAQTPAATPAPRPAPAIASQTVGSGKHANVLVKDLFAQQPDYAMWLVRSTRSAAPGSRIRQVGDYINSLPEYQNAVTEEKAKAEAVLTDENQSFLTGLKITTQQNPDGSITLRGKTYDRQDDLRAAGGRYSKDSRTYTISAAGLGQFIERSRTDSGTTGGQRSSGPAYSRDVELRKLRENADNRPDRSGLEGGVDNYLGVETQELIRQGEDFGIPREVGDEQIEDAALMVQAFATKRPFFMLSSAPGTGKTFVLGAGIREMKDRFARKIIYVTLNRGLIKQIKQDLKSYNIGDVKFITYSEMKDLAPEESDVLIFDEAHAIKNLTGAGSEQAKKAQEWIQQTKFPIFSTATPFENPTQTAYLLNTGIFDSFNGDYKQFAAAYGATPIKKDGQVVRTVWLPTKTNEQDQIAARNFFRKEGIFTARKTRLPAEQVDSRLVAIKGDQKWTDIYNAFSDEAENQKGSLDGTDKMWVINYKKRLLEASKVGNAINEAWRALNAGRWPIIFVETKAERTIDINEQRRLQQEFKRAKALAKMMGGESPKRSDYPGLLSDGLINLLESTMDKVGISAIEIPSAEEVIKREIGAQNVAIFTGSIPDAQAQKNLEEWRGKQPMVLVATMAKGGTGLSLHDKTGTHPTTQINVNLPWTATQVEQVSLRSARYGLKGKAQMMWLFADNIPFERELAQRVGGRMRDMGALVQGEAGATAANIKNFNFEDESFSEVNAAEAAKKDLTKEEPKVTPPAAPAAPAEPAVTAPKKRYKAREWAFKGDILDDIIDSGGVMSKSQAKKDKRLEKIQSLYDDAPRLDPYFNKIFAGRKRGEGSRNQPDVLLQGLAMENPGKYGDMTVAEFWAEVEKAARGRKGDVAAAKEEAKAAEEGAAEAQGLDAFLQAQDEAFVDAQAEEMQRLGEPDGPVEISAGSLAIGDRFFVQGELFEVTSVTPDGQYTIRDGEKFGVQQLTDGDTIFVDREPIRVSRSTEFLPPETEAPPQIPRLGAMQQQGDLLSGQSEAFALVGERGVDYERKQREAQAAARAAAEAKAAREKAQTQMSFGQSTLDAIDQITRNIDENQYSDPLLLTPLAKLALQIAKSLIRAGVAVDRAIRQAIAQARQQFPNDPTDDIQLADRLIRDAQYAEAVAAGDMETAQRMVDEAAKKAGYNVGPVFHGRPNNNEFTGVPSTVFEPSDWGYSGPGIYFTQDKSIGDRYASAYGSNGTNYRLYAKLNKPFGDGVLSDSDSEAINRVMRDEFYATKDASKPGMSHRRLFERLGDSAQESLDQIIKPAGFDGVFVKGGTLGDEMEGVVYDPSQIKSADPITRDDDGNVIPLSQRFQSTTADIRGARPAPVGEMSDAVAEASDAIAQFVESITPKAGITEGPTPEESARRVIEALTKLASVAIRAGIQNASQWATSLRLKLGPALQHAWDRAQGSTVEPTPEVIADVSSLPERAATDFGMIYSTPGDPVTTKRGGFEDVVAGRRALTPEVRNAGFQLAVDAFNEAGVKFRQVGDALFAPVDGVDQEAAGRELVRIAKDKIAKAKAEGRSDTIAELIQSLRNHFGISEAFSPETRDELYLIGQSEASEFGRNLASLKASVKDFVAVARNVRGFLTSAIYVNFNGESVKGVLDKIMTEFRGQFTEAEIQKIVGEKPDLQEMLNRFGVLALADTGGRVYRAVQARLKTKKAPTQKAKEQRALEDEAIEQIIENALALGVTEPAKPANRKLTPDERLALMTRPATQAKVQKATEDAVKEAEFNAGWKAMMADAAGNEELLGQYRDAMAAGEDPDPEAIERGLDLPQYAHWRTIREGFLNYSPTTLKLAQDVIRGRFKGTQFGPKKVAPPAPAKIDLARLVQQPNAEMSRVIGEQLAAIERVMDLAGASPEAKARVMQMITANVGSQVQLARQRVLNNFLDVKAKAGPTTASASLQRLINAGITEDPRYRSQKTRDLLKRVAKTYLTADELSGMATRTRAEKLAFLTGKLNQITAAEKLTDEWMQGAVWTYLTERMMEAENAVVSQIVGAKDVNFDPAQPKTDAQLEADRAKAVERLAGGIRAGLLDQRIAESVAKNPALQRLVPKMSDLVKRVLNTPQAGQAKLAQAFSEALLAELAIDQALADKTGVALAKAFEAKFERARIRALDLAVQKLTPKQREEVGPGRPLWQKIEEFVNAGGMNSATLLQSIAKKYGWKVPTDEEVSRLRDLARLEQELSTASEEEINAGITDDIKAAMNLGRRADIMREIQMRWARMTMPIRGNRQNLARAINEVTSAQLLFKPSFVTKQLIDVATQMFYYTPTRAVATAVERYRTSRDPNRASRLWKDTSAALEDAYKARFNALNMALTSALEAAKGRAERDTIMGIQSGIRALDRINAQASEYAKNGDYARSALVRMIGISQLSFRFASFLDAFQGVLAEQQEIGAWAESQLRLQGMAPEQARKTAKTIIGDAMAEYALAQAIVGDDPNISPKERRAAAWNVVRARQYQRIQAAGLDAGALKELTQELRSTIGWNIEEKFGPGGRIVGRGIKNASDWLASVGIPNPVGRFSNAIAIGINRALTFAGGGFVPKAFEGSAWYKTETDKTQRKIEAATGLGLSGAFAALVLSGALRVFTRWPDDKEEADLWEREGHRPNTMELELPGGKILRVSLNTGPIQVVRPALAAIGELQYQVAKRNRLNQKAEAAAKKKGLKFEPRELTAKDVGGALAYGAYSAVAQGRTASGMIGSGVYRQAPDMGKIAAGAVSPLIPFGPLLREVTAMSGAEFNPKDQTFINLLVPTPWSGKVDRNFLGDPVGTPRAQERIMSVLTGGTAIVGGEDPDRAYQVLAKTGWTPATPQNNKFFQFGRVQRQATPEELTRMQEVRAVELKSRISQLDPATATKRQLDRIEDIANAKAKKAVGIR